MKYLVFTDSHIHNWKNFGIDPVTKLSKRLMEQQKVLVQISNIAEQEKVDGAIFCGDLFHSVGNTPTECLNTAYMFFKSFKSPIYLVPGNHDLINRKNPNQFHYSGKIFNIFKCPSNIKLIGFHEEIDYEKVKGYDIVAIHQTPINAKVGNYEFPEGFNWQTLAQNNKFVFIGHIHQRQELSSNCIIVGSPMHLTFGDKGDRGVYIYDTDTFKATFYKLEYPEFITVDNIEDTKEDGNYYRVLKNTTKKTDNPNVVVSVTPTVFKERIQATTFLDILKEWLKINEKPETYLESIRDIADEKYQLGKKIFRGKVTQVDIYDFGSIHDISYDVSKGFNLVTGTNDVFDSNGSGKSTLFEAIYWCLFGETTKGLTGNDVIKRGEEDCEVSVFLETLTENFCISRSRINGIQITHKYTTQEEWEVVTRGLKQAERQKIIDNILGFDQTLFLSSCYFSQENILMLTGLSDSERTNLVTDLLGFENYDNLYTILFDRIKKDEADIEALVVKADNIDIEIGKYLSNINILKSQENDYIDKIKKSKELIESYSNRLSEIIIPELKIEKVEDSELLELRDIIKGVEKKITELENKKTELKFSMPGFNTSQTILHTKQDINHLKADQEKYKADILKLTSTTTKIDEKCDKCGSIITKEATQTFIDEKQQKIDNLDKEISILNIKLLGLERELADIEETNNSNIIKIETEIENKKAELETFITKSLTLECKKREQVEQQHQLELKHSQAISEQKEYTRLVAIYNDNVNDCTKKIAEITSQIENLNKKIENLIVISKQTVENIECLKQNVEVLEFWKTAFSSKGIKTLLLDKFCNDFNVCVNSYLSEISSGSMSIVMSPISTLKSGEERNKLEMLINLDNVVVKYESLSGGEKRRIDCSLCFGLSKYVTNRYGLSEEGLLGLIILDEVFTYLDKSGEEALAALLNAEGKNKAVFVIDHAFNLNSYVDNIWLVKKENGTSVLETNN